MSDAIATMLQKLAEVLQSEQTLGAALAGIAEAATVSVPGCDAASIAISFAGRPATAAITARVATLHLYGRTRPFDETAVSIGAVLAAQVAIAISRSPEFVAARAVVEETQRNVDDDADINLATGLLMVNEACTAEQAAGLLRQAAGHDEQTILEIARRIIEQHRSSQ